MEHRSYKSGNTCLILVLCLVLGSVICTGLGASASEFYPDGSLQTVDLTRLRKEGAERFPGLSPRQLQTLTRNSFESVYYGKLNRDRFLMQPTPELIQKQICSLLKASDQLREAVDDGISVIIKKGSPKERSEILQRIEADAAEIHKIFGGNFLETHASPLTVHLLIPPDNLGMFVLFIHETQRLVDRLSDEITSYFFDTQPSVLDVSDYRDHCSISAVTQVLVKMSREVEKRQHQSG
jgi:hypothetical protein